MKRNLSKEAKEYLEELNVHLYKNMAPHHIIKKTLVDLEKHMEWGESQGKTPVEIMGGTPIEFGEKILKELPPISKNKKMGWIIHWTLVWFGTLWLGSACWTAWAKGIHANGLIAGGWETAISLISIILFVGITGSKNPPKPRHMFLLIMVAWLVILLLYPMHPIIWNVTPYPLMIAGSVCFIMSFVNASLLKRKKAQ